MTGESADLPLTAGQAEQADLADLLAPMIPATPGLFSAPSLSPAPSLTSAPVRPSAGNVVAAAGAGRRFHPLPGTPLAVPVGQAAGLAAAVGTTVHAIEAGRTVPAQAGVVRVLTESGLHLEYRGVTGLAVDAGSAVAAGAVLGILGGGSSVAGGAGEPRKLPAGYSWLSLLITERDGGAVDAVALLVGLSDPAELGVSLAGTQLGLDPDALDRELGSALPGGSPA